MFIKRVGYFLVIQVLFIVGITLIWKAVDMIGRGSYKTEPLFFAFSMISGFLLLFWWTLINAYPEDLALQKSKPIVRVWTHNNVTMLVTDEQYRVSLSRLNQCKIIFGKENVDKRPTPELFAVFYTRFVIDWGYLSMYQYKLLTEGCVVEKTVMQIPPRHRYDHSLRFDQIWRAVYGPNAKPPETNV